jgi:hypothetical protein
MSATKLNIPIHRERERVRAEMCMTDIGTIRSVIENDKPRITKENSQNDFETNIMT